MGEVRTTVKLTNAVDLEVARRGFMPVEDVRSLEADALVDTGAVSLVLPSSIVERLGLARTGKRLVSYADGRQDEIDATGPVGVEILYRPTIAEAIVLGDEVIIGQIILEQMDLWVDTRERRLVPNPAHPDQPVIKIK